MCAFHGDLIAQSSRVVRVSINSGTVEDFLIELSRSTNTSIVFSSAQLPDQRFSMTAEGTVEDVLEEVLGSTNLSYSFRNGLIIVFPAALSVSQWLVKGFVIDAVTGEKLELAHVWDESSGRGTSTDESGYFELSLPGRSTTLRASYLGYQVAEVTVRGVSGDPIFLNLDRSVTIDEVIVYSRPRPGDAAGTEDHLIRPGSRPDYIGLGGVVDVQQITAQLPGVSTGADGVGGLNVRGGSYDQNLVLLDGVPVYNPTHAIGMLSVVNPQILQEVSFHKGVFSSRYSGRLSSVMGITTAHGDMKKWSFAGSIGPLSAEVMADGPVIPGKLSVLVSARTFLPSGYLSKLASREKESSGLSGQTDYGFQDLNARLLFQVNDRDRIDAGFYFTRDSYHDLTRKLSIFPDSRLSETYDKQLLWGNLMGSARWHRNVGPSGYSVLTFYMSRYQLQSLDNRSFSETEFNPRIIYRGFVNREFKTEIDDVGLQWNFDQRVSKDLKISTGFSAIHHTLKPKSVAFDDQFKIEQFEVDEATLDDALFSELNRMVVEGGVFVEGDWTITDKLSAKTGVHLSAFFTDGTSYWHPQPRLSLAYQPVSKVRLEMSGGMNVQYLHLITSSGIGLPTDLWVPSTGKIKPQESIQAVLSASFGLPGNTTLNWSVYQKWMDNLVMFKEGASFLLNEGTLPSSIVDATNWENKVVQGSGRVYGSEWSLNVPYAKGAFDLSYTLSRSTRQFDDINFGKEFAYRFDRTHTLNLSGNVAINRLLSAGFNWSYGSGTPITLTESRFLYESPGINLIPSNVEVLEFGEKNAYRLPAYHRLDLTISATWARPKAEHQLNLSLYNVYNRKNILHVSYIADASTQSYGYQQFTVLPFIPSVSYQIRL